MPSFEVDGNQYSPTYGTIRNIISEFRKQGKIKVNCNSKPVLYELIDSNLSPKSMTVNHMVVNSLNLPANHPVYKMLVSLPFDRQCIHNIRLRFTAPGLWNALYNTLNIQVNKRSQDIVIPHGLGALRVFKSRFTRQIL